MGRIRRPDVGSAHVGLLEPIDRINLLPPNLHIRRLKSTKEGPACFLCAFSAAAAPLLPNIPLTQTFHDNISQLWLDHISRNKTQSFSFPAKPNREYLSTEESLSLIVSGH